MHIMHILVLDPKVQDARPLMELSWKLDLSGW